MVNGHCDTVKATTDTGNATVTGSARQVTVATSLGSIEIRQDTGWSATSYSLTSDLGNINLNGPGAPAVNSERPLTGHAGEEQSLSITATADTGDITVTLGS